MKKHFGLSWAKLRFLSCFGSLAFSLGGCASATRVATAPEKLGQLGEVAAITAFSQPALNADIETSNIAAFTGGGLIPALIDAGINSSRSKKAAVTVAPIREALADFDLGQVFKATLQRELAGHPARLALPTVEVMHGADEKTLRARLAAGGESPLLVLRPVYCLTSDFSALSMSCLVWLQPAHPAAGDTKPLYRNFLGAYQLRPEGMAPDADPAARVAKWAENQGALARETMRTGAEELARLLAFDLARPGLPAGQRLYKDEGFPAVDIADLYPEWTGVWKKGREEKSGNGRVWVRTPNGDLLSFEK